MDNLFAAFFVQVDEFWKLYLNWDWEERREELRERKREREKRRETERGEKRERERREEGT